MTESGREQASAGLNVDIDAVEVFARTKGTTGQTVFYLALADRIFEEALHGHTWRGAFEKTTPGLRVNLIYSFCRCYLNTSEAYRDSVPREVLERNPERFARLMGEYTSSGWKSEVPDYEK